MNNHIKGILFEKLPGMAVIDVRGMGFQIYISMNTYSDLPEVNEEVIIYTYISIKNEELRIFGFSSIKEKMLFNQLTNIPKIGPKTALAVFNTLNPEQFEQAIFNADSKTISTVKGISQKTADRIILELSGKIEFGHAGPTSDAYDALLVLGFKPKNIESAINDVMKMAGDEISVEEIIKQALQRLR